MRNDFINEVRKVLEAGLDGGDVSLHGTARKAAMSRRAIQRELTNQGTNFRGVLDTVRYRIAVDLLKQKSDAACEIATLLGYSHLSSFHRAFKRWTGKTPRKFLRS